MKVTKTSGSVKVGYKLFDIHVLQYILLLFSLSLSLFLSPSLPPSPLHSPLFLFLASCYLMFFNIYRMSVRTCHGPSTHTETRIHGRRSFNRVTWSLSRIPIHSLQRRQLQFILLHLSWTDRPNVLLVVWSPGRLDTCSSRHPCWLYSISCSLPYGRCQDKITRPRVRWAELVLASDVWCKSCLFDNGVIQIIIL